jgi:hypothetical protein
MNSLKPDFQDYPISEIGAKRVSSYLCGSKKI